ncbi:MAG: IPT/TIG domain-containing protein [Salinibacterium sp.]|nr:IPT/TIG domain-containing protein [Salinibacterium sp.]MBF0672796.1 IPT/TIG domain-containing protein [Salinibacterium sp.]
MPLRDVSSGLVKGAEVMAAAALLFFGAAAPVAAAVDAVSPAVGPVAGGNTVTITGDCFAGATDVSFGGVPAPSFNVVSDTTVTAVVPPGASGTVDVAVAGVGACGVSELPDGYRYTSNPIIWALSPAEGPVEGGTAVTIEGANLAGVTSVFFGGIEIPDFTLVSSTQIIVFSPPGEIGTVDVVAEGPYGSSTAPFSYVLPGGGTVTPPPPVVPGTPVTPGVPGGDSVLPVTGADASILAALAGSLLLAGAAAVALRRSRSE